MKFAEKNDSEIVKALKEIFEQMLNEGDLQRASTINKVLDLINRLKVKLDEAEDTIQYADKELKKANTKIEELKENLNSKHKWEDMCNKTLREVKTEAYKDCIEKAKRKAFKINYCGSRYNVVDIDDFDNLLKELVGDIVV